MPSRKEGSKSEESWCEEKEVMMWGRESRVGGRVGYDYWLSVTSSIDVPVTI